MRLQAKGFQEKVCIARKFYCHRLQNMRETFARLRKVSSTTSCESGELFAMRLNSQFGNGCEANFLLILISKCVFFALLRRAGIAEWQRVQLLLDRRRFDAQPRHLSAHRARRVLAMRLRSLRQERE